MKLLMKLLFICVIVGLVYPCSATVFLRFAKSVKVRHDPTQIVGKLKSTQVPSPTVFLSLIGNRCKTSLRSN